MRQIIQVLSTLMDRLPKIRNFQAPLHALISHVDFTMYNILVF